MHAARITNRPWRAPSEPGSPKVCAGFGLTLIAPAEMGDIQLAGERLPLPQKCLNYQKGGTCYVNCWLPGTSRQPSRQYLLPDGATHEVAGFLLRAGTIPDDQQDSSTNESALLGFMDELVRNNQHLRWKAEELAEESTWQWLGRKRPFLPLPWPGMLDLLTIGDEPRTELVVRFIKDAGNRILKLAEQPRQVLRRRRSKQHVGRVQQMDSNCLAWLVRQPGRTALEKAGSRQEIMAVVRSETVDTLENRVLRDLLLRAERTARSWLRTNGKHSDSSAYKLVNTFVRKVKTTLQRGQLEGVGTLVGVPTPNYVLRQDQAYRHVWTWYLKFVQQQSDLDDAWPWQERLWSETAALFLATALCSMSADDYEVSSHTQQAMWVGDKPIQGRWLADICWPGPLLLKGKQERSAVMLSVNQVPDGKCLAGVNMRDWLGTINAEYLVILQPTIPGVAGIKIVAVWTLLTLANLPMAELENYCREAAQNLHVCSGNFCDRVMVEGLIIASGQCNTEPTDVGLALSTVQGIPVTGAVAPANVIGDADEFMMLLRMVLGDALRENYAD